MNNSPIETVIRNLCDVDKTIQWTGGGSIWIGKKSSVTVPYDVWTAADRKQRESLMAACQQKSVCLTLRVLQADGKVIEVDYDPSIIMKPRMIVTPQAPKSNQFIQGMQDDDKMHTINATSGAGAAAATHYGATKTQEDEGVGAHAEGANLNGFQKDTDTDVTGTKQKLEDDAANNKEDEDQENPDAVLPDDAAGADDANAADTEQKQEEQDPEAGMAVSIDSIRQKFNELVAEKQWESALELLVEFFGKDKVTFTTRTLMSLKDFDAVATKYNLL